MNFYSNKLPTSKYLNLFKKYKKKITTEFLIRNYGTFMGDKSFYKTLACYELLNQTKKVKGDVVEFGIWNANSLFTMKKIVDFLNVKKKVIGYDNFKGFSNDPIKGYSENYAGDKNFVKYMIKFYNFKNIKIIDDNIMNLEKNLKFFKKISFMYIDCDLYEPTEKILSVLSSKISKGGIIALSANNDHPPMTLKNYNDFAGEGIAMREFYSRNKKRYKLVKLKRYYQPDTYLKKIV